MDGGVGKGRESPFRLGPVERTILRADQGIPREDTNSGLAHQQLVEKARKGGIDLYFLGDSITRRWGTSDEAYKEMYANWKENFFGWNAANFGWGGDTTQNILWRIQNGELNGVNPKVIVLLAGTNNLGSGAKSGEVVNGIQAILRVCREKSPKSKIVLMGVLPRSDNPSLRSEIEQTNRGLAKLAKDGEIRFLDISAQMLDGQRKLRDGMTVDGLHLAVKGYQVWADALNPILIEWLGVRAKFDTAPPPTGDPSVVKPPLTR